MSQPASQRFRFSTRTLFIATLVLAAIFALVVSGHRAWQRTLGIGTIRSADKWPRAFAQLVDDDPELASNVQLYGLGDFIDHKSLWLIDGDSALLDELIALHANEPTTDSHPLADDLISSIPGFWPKPGLKSCTWHTTPGYGQQHIEGVDLFLVLRDSTSNRAYILHEWIF